MFRWYKKAKICYAYLEDVDDVSELARSRWFTRGWTLQELIAPKDVSFYSTNWTFLGSKSDLRDNLEAITGISQDVLSGASESWHECIATRMRWAANRQTTRLEDMAYCLLGIFDVQMPLLYGEGKRAFTRLQQEIMRGSDDQSLFAWGVPESPYSIEQLRGTLSANETYGLLADSPRGFLLATEIEPVRSKQRPTATSKSSTSVQIELPVAQIAGRQVAILACTTPERPGTYLGFCLNHWDMFYTSRGGEILAIPARDWLASQVKMLEMRQISSGLPRLPSPVIRVVHGSHSPYYQKPDIHALQGASYVAAKNVILPHNHSGPSAVMIFEPSDMERVKSNQTPHERKLIKYKRPATGFALIFGADPRPWVAFVPILHPDHAHSQFHHLAKLNPDFIRFCMTKASLQSALSKGQGDMGFLTTQAETLELMLDRWAYIHEKDAVRGYYIKKITLKVWFSKAPDDYFVDSELNVRVFLK